MENNTYPSEQLLLKIEPDISGALLHDLQRLHRVTWVNLWSARRLRWED